MWVQASLCLEYYAVMVGSVRYPSPEIHLRKTSAGSPWVFEIEMDIDKE